MDDFCRLPTDPPQIHWQDATQTLNIASGFVQVLGPNLKRKGWLVTHGKVGAVVSVVPGYDGLNLATAGAIPLPQYGLYAEIGGGGRYVHTGAVYASTSVDGTPIVVKELV